VQTKKPKGGSTCGGTILPQARETRKGGGEKNVRGIVGTNVWVPDQVPKETTKRKMLKPAARKKPRDSRNLRKKGRGVPKNAQGSLRNDPYFLVWGSKPCLLGGCIKGGEGGRGGGGGTQRPVKKTRQTGKKNKKKKQKKKTRKPREVQTGGKGTQKKAMFLQRRETKKKLRWEPTRGKQKKPEVSKKEKKKNGGDLLSRKTPPGTSNGGKRHKNGGGTRQLLCPTKHGQKKPKKRNKTQGRRGGR